MIISLYFLILNLNIAAPELIFDSDFNSKEIINKKIIEKNFNDQDKILEKIFNQKIIHHLNSIKIKKLKINNQKTAALSEPGVIYLKEKENTIQNYSVFIQHEIAHQYLFSICPSSYNDFLFHELYAIINTQEYNMWDTSEQQEHYLSLNQSKEIIEKSKNLHSIESRKAIIRILKEKIIKNNLNNNKNLTEENFKILKKQIQKCISQKNYLNLEIEDIFNQNTEFKEEKNTSVIINRHSGEIKFSSGNINKKIPFASTLKPFLIAESESQPPLLTPNLSQNEWKMCHSSTQKKMSIEEALPKSCNGYFIDWLKNKPDIYTFKNFGNLFLKLGLSHLPSNIYEAIGIQSNLSISTLSLAQAYRFLAELRPDIIQILNKTISTGTLSIVQPKPPFKIAFKTGTVRDPNSNVILGILIAITDDFIFVFTDSQNSPSNFYKKIYPIIFNYQKKEILNENKKTEVNAFNLHSEKNIFIKCPKITGIIKNNNKFEINENKRFLTSQIKDYNSLICINDKFKINLFSIKDDERKYSGIFYNKNKKIYFKTNLKNYTLGVLEQEDSLIKNPAKQILTWIIGHNAHHSHHLEQDSVCDTTHCQVFHGDPSQQFLLDQKDKLSFTEPEILSNQKWIMFSKGGDKNWSKKIDQNQLFSFFNKKIKILGFKNQKISYQESNNDFYYEEIKQISCEKFRNNFKLPSCPKKFEIKNNEYLFSGSGEGHSSGLNIENLKKENSRSAIDILKEFINSK